MTMASPRFHWTRRKVARDDMAALRAAIEVEQTVEFWGGEYRITPRLLDRVFGDGKKLCVFEPANTRPDYYVFLGDSRWDLGEGSTRATVDPADWSEEVLDAIEDQFGICTDDYCDECDDDPDMECHEHEHRGFPALSDDSGYTWGRVEWPDRPVAAAKISR